MLFKSKRITRKVLPKIGIEGTILFTPGHTKDGVSIILENGAIFSGDVMNSLMFNFLGIKKQPIYVQNFDEILGSWKRYIEMGGRRIYPAHGKPFPIKQLEKAIKNLKRMELIKNYTLEI